MPLPTSIARSPKLTVTVDGVNLPYLLGAKWSLGLDMRYGEATVSTPVVTIGIGWRSVISISAGGTSPALRWRGLAVEFDNTLSPIQADIVAKGPLWFAGQDVCGDPAGTDLSNAGAGQTDQQIVNFLLTQAGIQGGFLGGLGGTGKTLGTVATDQYRWAYAQSALSMIDALDQICLGWRTYENTAGQVVRTQITTLPGTSVATFTEGVDIFSGKGQNDILATANTADVTGYNPPGAAAPFHHSIYNPISPIVNTIIASVNSSLVEKALAADPGNGLSCEEVATWLLGEVNRPMATLQFETPRDDLISPGQTITVSSPQRLGLNQALWVQRVEGEVDAKGMFTQRFTCIGTAPSNLVGHGLPVGGLVS